MQNRSLAAILFLTALLSTSFSQGREPPSLVVRVLDPQGAGVPDARVTVSTRDGRVRLLAWTGAAGSHLFEKLGPGEYFVDVEAAGFTGAAARVVRLHEGERAEIDLLLEIAAHREEVVVTASGTIQTVDEASKAIDIVDAAEVDERDEVSIPEALRTVPGLRVQQIGGPGASTSIKMRGLRNEDTAILIDGVRIRDAAAPQGDATAFLGELVATDLDRIEVLRGSGSSLYGSNAVGGVINIVSKEGGGRLRGNFLSEGGSLGFFRVRGQAGGGASQDRLTYSVGVEHLNIADGLDGDDPARTTSAQGRARIRISPTTTLGARFYIVDAYLKLNESPLAAGTLPPAGIIDAVPVSLEELAHYESGAPISARGGANFIPSVNDPDYEQDSGLASALVTFEQRPSGGFGYMVSYHGLTTSRSLFDGPEGVTGFEPIRATRSDYEGRIHTIHARADVEWGSRNLLTAGYELESESFASRSFPEDPAAKSSVDVTERSNSFFVQDQLRFLEGALQTSGAFRAQFFSIENPVFDPPEGSPYQRVDIEPPEGALTADGSVAYFFRGSGTKLRGHVGNGYRAPSLYERFGTFFGTFGYSVYGDPSLGPERSIGLDAGLDQYFAGGKLRASATFFYTRLQKVILFDFSGAIDPATDPLGRFAGYRRVDGGSARGLELSAAATAAGRLRLGLSYTYTDAARPTGSVEEVARAYGIPEHQFSLVATQRLASGFYVNLDLTVSSSHLAPVFDPTLFASRSYRFDGIANVDLGASYELALSGWGGLRLFAKLDNLFDRTYFENGFRTPDRTGYAGAALDF